MKLILAASFLSFFVLYRQIASAGESTKEKETNTTTQANASLLRPGWALEANIIGLVNPEVIIVRTELNYQIPYREKFNMVWSQFSLGYHLRTSPVRTATGAQVTWMPAAVLKIRAAYSLLFYHNWGGSLAVFDTPEDGWNDDNIQESGNERFAMGHRFAVTPTLQLYFKGVLLLGELDARWILTDTEKPYLFNWESLAVSETNDSLYTFNTMLMYNFFRKHQNRSFFLGSSYTLDYQPSSNMRRQSIALSVMVEPLKDPGALGKLRFIVIGGVYVEDFYRKNEPFALIVAGSTFDLRD